MLPVQGSQQMKFASQPLTGYLNNQCLTSDNTRDNSRAAARVSTVIVGVTVPPLLHLLLLLLAAHDHELLLAAKGVRGGLAVSLGLHLRLDLVNDLPDEALDGDTGVDGGTSHDEDQQSCLNMYNTTK